MNRMQQKIDHKMMNLVAMIAAVLFANVLVIYSVEMFTFK